MQRLPHFIGQPTSGQFAKNGVWETAWSFAPDAIPDEKALQDYLAGVTEVSFEAFFGQAFFGIRYTGLAEDVADFAHQCLAALAATCQGTSFFTVLCAGLKVPSLNRQFAFAEVGAVNAWKSVGAFRIADPKAVLKDFDTFWQQFSDSPVARNQQYPKAIEFAFNEPLHHWYGIPLSDTSAPFAISADQLRQCLGLVDARDASSLN